MFRRKETEQERRDRLERKRLKRLERQESAEFIDDFIRFSVLVVSKVFVKVILPIYVILEVISFLYEKYA